MEFQTLAFKAITKLSTIKHHDLPGPMVRVGIEQVTFYLTPEQAWNAGIKLINLAAVANDAGEGNK